MLNDLLSKSILAELDEAIITDVQIGEGEMTLTGTITPD
jgi:hypothetical protein